MYHQPNRRFLALALLLVTALALVVVSFSRGLFSPWSERLLPAPTTGILDIPLASSSIHPQTLHGAATAPSLGNETAKAELGRAAWKLFHTTFARFPDEPSEDEQSALNAYVYLFARLYPCGECASHFAEVLREFPPQVVTRSAAAAWGCHVHNVVNKKLGKDEFDCSKIGDFYKCGCTDGEAKKGDSGEKEKEKEKDSEGEGG